MISQTFDWVASVLFWIALLLVLTGLFKSNRGTAKLCSNGKVHFAPRWWFVCAWVFAFSRSGAAGARRLGSRAAGTGHFGDYRRGRFKTGHRSDHRLRLPKSRLRFKTGQRGDHRLFATGDRTGVGSQAHSQCQRSLSRDDFAGAVAGAKCDGYLAAMPISA